MDQFLHGNQFPDRKKKDLEEEHPRYFHDGACPCSCIEQVIL